MISNTREQLFHAWRSFHFNKNTETIDAYVHHIRQVTILLGYEEPLILEVFKNTLPTRLYCILFPTVDLWQAVDSKENLNKRENRLTISRTSSSTLFMNI